MKQYLLLRFAFSVWVTSLLVTALAGIELQAQTQTATRPSSGCSGGVLAVSATVVTPPVPLPAPSPGTDRHRSALRTLRGSTCTRT